MIHPTDQDIGRLVVYRRAEMQQAQRGFLSRFTEDYAFVSYLAGVNPIATSFKDLEWEF